MGRISNCCGAPAKSNGDCDTEDFGLCSDCGEHCSYEDEPQEKMIDLLAKVVANNNEMIALVSGLNKENKATYSKKIAAIINETILIMKKTPQANGAINQ